MRWQPVVRLFGLLLIFYSGSFLSPVAVSLYYADEQWSVFIMSFIACLAMGMVLWWPMRRANDEIRVREGYLVVALFWILLGAVGGLPFLFGLHLGFTDAIFESISGFSSTGATVIHGLDELPRSVLFHRQQIQWLGGMGIIVLAVAVLPLLGVGGMQLYQAEASGVAKHEKITPRISETARSLWLIYVVLTAGCAVAYRLAGMPWFEAIGHAMSTVATGGFSTHDASLGFYDSALIESIAIVFMMAGGTNFALHFLCVRQAATGVYLRDAEFRAFIGILVAITLIATLVLWIAESERGLLQAMRAAAFHVVSIMTTTGFTTETFASWPLFLPLLICLVAYVGGCAGSTSGGIKVLRILLLFRLGIRQLFSMAHPRAIAVIKHNGKRVPEEQLFSVLGFHSLFIAVSLLLTLAMMAAGLDLSSAFGAVSATITLMGPGLGKVASDFSAVNDSVKWLGIFGMLVGRLEVFTLLILFLPAYWKR